jgi:hypothetical protein
LFAKESLKQRGKGAKAGSKTCRIISIVAIFLKVIYLYLRLI